MYKKIRDYIELNIRRTLAILSGTITVIWILSQFVPSLGSWLQSEHLLEVITVVLLGEALTVLIEFKRQANAKSVTVHSDQLEASAMLMGYIETHKPTTADLIELSASTVDSVLESLRQNNCKIRLLVQNPESSVTDYQKHRVTQRMNDLASLTFKGYDRCEIKVYSTPAAIRGRLFDDKLVNIGWYTYSSSVIGVYGHSNPLVSATTDTTEGRQLKLMFQQAFESLWNHPQTIGLDAAVSKVQ